MTIHGNYYETEEYQAMKSAQVADADTERERLEQGVQDAEEALSAAKARLYRWEMDHDTEPPEFPTYVGWDGQEHGEY